jgi:hypothetical protein
LFNINKLIIIESTRTAIFGVVSRPFTKNPQFVNVSPIDKSIDNASFQIERKLVKKEREKNPDIITKATKATENVTNEQNLPNKILRNSHKVQQPYSIIIPDKVLVENIEVLNVLVVLYNGFLNYNLVINPMTEFYFIIQLITIQYKNNVPKQCFASSQITNLESYKTDINNDLDGIPSNLLILQESLNSDYLEEKNVKNIKYKIENIEQCIQSDDKFYNLKQFEVNNEYITHFKEENNVEESNINKVCVKKYLDTPHNCVYFSTQVLNYQKPFLKCLDRVTLRLLCENNQIVTFHPELCKYLNKIYNIKVTESNQIKDPINIGYVIKCF